MMKRILYQPLPVLFFAMTLVMLAAYLLKPEDSFSYLENRYLQGRPKFSVEGLKDGSFMSRFETYTDEQIPLRDDLIKLKSISETILLKSENNGIARGRDRYLFTKVLKDDERLYGNESLIEDFARECGRDIYLVIAPNASEMLPRLLPRGLPVSDQTKNIKGFYEEASLQPNIHVIDLGLKISDHTNEQLYYRTDHHWTTKAAYYAYEEIIKRIGLNKAVDYTRLESGSISDFYGTLYAKYKGIGIKPDVISYFEIPIDSLEYDDEVKDSLYDMSKAEEYDKYAMFLWGNHGLTRIKASNGGNGRKLILFKDSYANCLVPFLTYNYDEILVVDLRYYGDSVKELLDDNPYADLMMLYNYANFAEDSNLYKLLR